MTVACSIVQYLLSSVDLERFEYETDRANRKEILDQVAKHLPVQCRTVTGGVKQFDFIYLIN